MQATSELASVDRSDRTGLTEAQAAGRLAADGPNELPRPESRTLWRIVREVLSEPMFALLLAGGTIYLLIGEPKDAAVLLGFATLSVAIAIVQEARSERVLEALRDLSSPTALVIREGVRRRIPARELVCGDLVSVAEGDRAPADARLIEAHELSADESLLTGESVPVEKTVASGAQPPTPEAAEGAIYAGTLLVHGTGVAEVAATGRATQMGRIGAALEQIKPEATRLTRQTRRLVQGLGLFAAAVFGSVVLILGLRGDRWLEGLLGGVAVGMAMIPEEFPLVLAVFMVMGSWRISRAGVLTRKAAAIETLGSATVLCTDKTGTLTENRMTVVAGWRNGRRIEVFDGRTSDPDLAALVRIGVLASEPNPFDPMERAFHAAGPTAAEAKAELVQAYGLRADLMAVTHVWATAAGGRIVAAKGAPEAIVDLCRLTEPERTQILDAAETMAREGMRVLGLAQGQAEGELPATARGLTLGFEGLIGLADPIRPDVPAAVHACHEAGVRVVMITGDHPATAHAIAQAAGIRADAVMTGVELADLSDEAFAAEARAVTVFARILPEQKLRIVRALQGVGEVVAMTGDGVNDAPALKAADIGVAMGERGSDVAREAASLVLLKDGFGAIVQTIRLGRRIYDNLRRSMGFILAVHLPIAGLAVVPLLADNQIVLGPVHIAFLEMFIDPVCAIAFEAEPEDPNVMRRPPRNPKEPLFAGRALLLAAARGAIGLAAVLAVFQFSLWRGLSPDSARTSAFLALVATDIALVLASRLSSAGWMDAVVRPNRTLWALMTGLIGLLVVVLATPLGRALFNFGPASVADVGLALASGLTVLVVGLAMPPAASPPRSAM
jgi:Ca2+-transporting ATPase